MSVLFSSKALTFVPTSISDLNVRVSSLAHVGSLLGRGQTLRSCPLGFLTCHALMLITYASPESRQAGHAASNGYRAQDPTSSSEKLLPSEFSITLTLLLSDSSSAHQRTQSNLACSKSPTGSFCRCASWQGKRFYEECVGSLSTWS